MTAERAQPYEEDLPRLDAALADAMARSQLPNDPANAQAIDRFLIRERLAASAAGKR